MLNRHSNIHLIISLTLTLLQCPFNTLPRLDIIHKDFAVYVTAVWSTSAFPTVLLTRATLAEWKGNKATTTFHFSVKLGHSTTVVQNKTST